MQKWRDRLGDNNSELYRCGGSVRYAGENQYDNFELRARLTDPFLHQYDLPSGADDLGAPSGMALIREGDFTMGNTFGNLWITYVNSISVNVSAFHIAVNLVIWSQ